MSTPAPGISPGDALERSYKRSVVDSDQQKARFLLETLGPRIVAVGVGLSDARPVRNWAQGRNKPRGETENRLRILYRVAFAVSSVFGPDTAAAFVRGANPELD